MKFTYLSLIVTPSTVPHRDFVRPGGTPLHLHGKSRFPANRYFTHFVSIGASFHIPFAGFLSVPEGRPRHYKRNQRPACQNFVRPGGTPLARTR